jgi:hypothetical protein
MGNFYQDAIVKDPRFKSPKRVADLAMLEPVTRKLVGNIVADAAAHGMKLIAYETFRSQARQAALFDQGVTKLKNVGVHNFGLACDLVKDVGGEPSWKGDFSLLGQLAHQYGLIWGGDWGDPTVKHSFVDEYHVQRCSIGRQASLFSGTWYPKDNYDPYKSP